MHRTCISPTTLRSGLNTVMHFRLWIFQHKAPTTAGLNAIIRTLFFKILKLLQHPILPLFVFDGPEKPKMKRNQKTTGHFGTNDKASRDFKRLLDEMGLEYWNVSIR